MEYLFTEDEPHEPRLMTCRMSKIYSDKYTFDLKKLFDERDNEVLIEEEFEQYLKKDVSPEAILIYYQENTINGEKSEYQPLRFRDNYLSSIPEVEEVEEDLSEFENWDLLKLKEHLQTTVSAAKDQFKIIKRRKFESEYSQLHIPILKEEITYLKSLLWDYDHEVVESVPMELAFALDLGILTKIEKEVSGLKQKVHSLWSMCTQKLRHRNRLRKEYADKEERLQVYLGNLRERTCRKEPLIDGYVAKLKDLKEKEIKVREGAEVVVEKCAEACELFQESISWTMEAVNEPHSVEAEHHSVEAEHNPRMPGIAFAPKIYLCCIVVAALFKLSLSRRN